MIVGCKFLLLLFCSGVFEKCHLEHSFITLVNNDFAPEIKIGDSESIFRAECEHVLDIVPSSTDFPENVRKFFKTSHPPTKVNFEIEIGNSRKFFPVEFEYGFRFFVSYLVVQNIEFL